MKDLIDAIGIVDRPPKRKWFPQITGRSLARVCLNREKQIAACNPVMFLRRSEKLFNLRRHFQIIFFGKYPRQSMFLNDIEVKCRPYFVRRRNETIARSPFSYGARKGKNRGNDYSYSR